jgi:hypothetical protein
MGRTAATSLITSASLVKSWGRYLRAAERRITFKRPTTADMTNAWLQRQ